MEKEIDYFDKFYEVRTEYYYHKNSDFIREQTGEKEKAFQYQEVSPVYVYSLNKNWNGENTFDICPVDFSKPKNKTASWRWRMTTEKKDIGKKIFKTRAEAVAKYNEIPEAQREKYEEIKQMKRLS